MKVLLHDFITFLLTSQSRIFQFVHTFLYPFEEVVA